jgi:tRNA(Ile)-lysidine synthase TilS/MesJ
MDKKKHKETVFIMPNGEGVNSKEFSLYFQKKVKRTIKKFDMFRLNSTITVMINSMNSVALLYVISKLAMERKLNLSFDIENLKKSDEKIVKQFCSHYNIPLSKKKKGIIATAESTDEIAAMIIDEQMKKKMNMKKALPVFGKPKTIRPLYLLTDKEIELFIKLKGMPLIEKKKYPDTIGIINQLEKKHPEIKHAIVNSFIQVMDLF